MVRHIPNKLDMSNAVVKRWQLDLVNTESSQSSKSLGEKRGKSEREEEQRPQTALDGASLPPHWNSIPECQIR